MNTVELHQAYFWHCDDCGRENYSRPVVCEITPELKEDMIRQGVPAKYAVGGGWVTRPETVKCSACGATFEASDPFIDDDEAAGT